MPPCSIELTEQQLQQITDLAGLFFTPRQIAVIMELPAVVLITGAEIDSSPVYKAFWAGRLKEEFNIRTKIKKLAESGSSPAQTMMMDIINDSRIKMMDR